MLDAEHVAADALNRASGRTARRHNAAGALGFSLVETLNGQKKHSESLAAARSTLEYDRARPGPVSSSYDAHASDDSPPVLL